MQKLVDVELSNKLYDYVLSEMSINPLDYARMLAKSYGEVILEKFKSFKESKISIICGKGNNGLSGLAIAEALLKSDFSDKIEILFFEKKSTQSSMAKKINISLARLTDKVSFFKQIDIDSVLESDLIIDALFGTGFNKNPEDIYFNIIDKINKSKAKVISVDLPSGIHGTTGYREDISVHADYTLTSEFSKIGLYLNDGYENAGEISPVRSEIFNDLDEQFETMIKLIDSPEDAGKIKKRKLHSVKKDYGKIFNFSGSIVRPGSAILSSLAALRTGAGLLKLGMPMNICTSLAAVHPEIMNLPLAYNQPGYTSTAAEKEIMKGYKWSDAVLIGPGISVHTETRNVTKSVLTKIEKGKPLILDDDALNIIYETLDLIKGVDAPVILTPQAGEMSRLAGTTREIMMLDCINIVPKKAKEWGCYILYKGTPTIIADPNGKVEIFINKNPGLATQGTGAILSGILVSLLGQGIEVEKAIRMAMFIFREAGFKAVEKFSLNTMLAEDLLTEIPSAVRKFEE